MSFQGDVPVHGAHLRDRKGARARLDAAIERLVRGDPSWLAILGPREVGKTSLVLEAARRHASAIGAVVVDASAHAPTYWDAFGLVAARALDPA